MLVVALSGTACATGNMATVDAAYRRGDYKTSLQQAQQIYVKAGAGRQAEEAAYYAGLSAHQLNDLPTAHRYLNVAGNSDDHKLAGQAWGEMAVVYAQQRNYDLSARSALRAADLLTGEEKANALFRAGASLQKLGNRMDQARDCLTQARKLTQDRALAQKIDEQLAMVGYTIQVGAYSTEDGARKAAQQLAATSGRLRLGTPQVLHSTDARGRSMYLVQIGRFASDADAQQQRRQLGAAAPGAVVVPLVR